MTLTATLKGVNGNEITVSTNYYGTLGSEFTPPGLGITLPTTGMLTGGVGVPDMDTAITNIAKLDFEYVAMPYTDSELVVCLGSGIRLHRSRPLGLEAPTIRPRLLRQARPLRRL